MSERPADEHDQQAMYETARSRFSALVEHSGAQVSALATAEEGEGRARSLVTLAGDWFDLARAQGEKRSAGLLERGLGSAVAGRVERESGRGSLLTVLAEAEVGGMTRSGLLREVADGAAAGTSARTCRTCCAGAS
ncbi:hypothetical protein, partial [Pseudonocardia sp. ICBG1034]|uniref:hypothetical protein n=1 Tax=Pseudonocardia sp. ICBG1034 TaxID=2844381 RepID=UPI001CCF1588